MSNIWYEVGRAIRQLIIGARAGQKTGTKQSPQLKAKPKARPKAQPKAAPSRSAGQGNRSRSTSDQYVSGDGGEHTEGSPGQFGSGRTRDVLPQDLKRLRLEYAPNPDGDPDPGEVIWTWVPYVENDGRGKDRPVLIIGRLDLNTVVGCYLSTKQHRGFISIGSGGWDSEGRESFLSPERLLQISHEGMRRESAQIDRQRFETTVAAVLAFHRQQ